MKPVRGLGVKVLAELRRRKVVVEVVGDKLRFQPVGNTNRELRRMIATHKGEIMALILAEKEHEESGRDTDQAPAELTIHDGDPEDVVVRYELKIRPPKGAKPRRISPWWVQEEHREKKMRESEKRAEAQEKGDDDD